MPTSSGSFVGTGTLASLDRGTAFLQATGFSEVTIELAEGESPQPDIGVIDYVFNQIGG